MVVIREILSGITAGSLTVGTPINLVRRLISPGLINDFCMPNDGGSLSTTVFCKKIHTDCCLDFLSHQPLAHKDAVT